MEPLLEVIEGLAPAALFEEACKLSSAKGWYYGHASNAGDGGRFWKMDLDGIAVFDAIWKTARERCEAMAGGPLQVLRQYANGHTYGLGGQPHVDDVRPGSFTLLFYPLAEWKDEWEGETVFYDEHGEIALSVRPRPNRAVLFDSRILHAGRAPGRACPALRVSMAYKLQRVEEEAVPAPPTAGGGVERSYAIQVTSAEFQRMVEEHLTQLGASLRLPGFRPGKIPPQVLEQRYGARARDEAVKRLALETPQRVVPAGSILSSVEVSPDRDGVEVRITALHPPSLPEPDFSGVTLTRLTAGPEWTEALRAHLNQQILDHLAASYNFVAPALMVEREFAAIRQAVEQQGAEGDAAGLRQIAERRVRLGIVVAELARRLGFSGAAIEAQVIEQLLTRPTVEERPATEEELQELA